ncbi:MAG TPA: hypothetical protein VGS58_22545, partial [Candidatus Sulfopaludibacter sp.]|nr:hypothetical protein [Candidatus Sulfopaludibacter sp.]
TTVPRIAAYLMRMQRAGMGEYVAYTLRDSVRRFPAITATAEWLRVLGNPDLAGLIMGVDLEEEAA